MAETKSIAELRADLKKIDQSIEVTRSKMKEIKDVSFLPDLYFVLAEMYVEKSRYLYTINREINAKVPISEIDFSDSAKAKKQAIETYQRYIENFPKGENIDKAYFFMAHSQRELGQNEDMVKIYLKITKEFPKSPFWEESQLILGDFFLEQKKDARMALDFYQKILERPPNPFMAPARYKLGWCLINLNKMYDAMLAFEGVITIDGKIDLEKLPEIYRKSDIRRDALLALVWPYSEQKDHDPSRAQALNYFEGLCYSRQTLLRVLVKLSKRLMLKENFDQAIPVYLRTLEISHDLETRTAALDGFYEAFKRSKKNWPLEILPPIVADTLIRLRSSPDVKAPEKKRFEKNFEIYLRDFATRLQMNAKASHRRADYDKAIEAYETYLSIFQSTPFVPAMALNLAESYYAIRAYARAGYYYEKLARRPSKEAKKTVMDSSVQSYAFALKNKEKLSKIENWEAREGFRDIGQLYVKQYPGDSANAMITFNIGRTYYDERDFDRAVTQFKSFINLYPLHKEVTTAGQMILDSFNQREDYEGLIRAGKELVASPKIQNAQFKKDVGEIVRQAEYRKIQDQAGDPRSREYAKKLLSFASKYQGTSLGDQALYEAFVSFKKKKDLAAYDPGEQLLLRHGDSKYAKEVVGQMGKMALDTADFRRASKYFEIFARKYPSEKESTDLLFNAAQMREVMGDYREASDDFRDLGRLDDVSKQMVLSQNWTALAQTLSARAIEGVQKNYWMGLALFRQGNLEPARGYLNKAVQARSTQESEKNMAAHALYLIASIDLQDYQRVKLGTGNEAELVKTKQGKLQQLIQKLNTVIGYGDGRWTIAALYEMARAHQEFAEFLLGASVPPELNPQQQAQYRQLIAQQAANFRKKANGFFQSCIDNAEKYEVFTGFAKGCFSKGQFQVRESEEEKILARAGEAAPSEALGIRRKLIDQPKDTKLLRDLAQAYLQVQDYAMARTILTRSLEINSGDMEAQALIGVSYLLMNDLEPAAAKFKLVLKRNPKQAMALHGLGLLYQNFKFERRAQPLRARLSAIPKPSILNLYRPN